MSCPHTLGKFDNIRHTYCYKINDTELEHVPKENDLGIIMDGDLSFEEHISLKVKKANAIMGLIRHSFSFLDSHLFKKLCITSVRPHCEYACSVMGNAPINIHKHNRKCPNTRDEAGRWI